MSDPIPVKQRKRIEELRAQARLDVFTAATPDHLGAPRIEETRNAAGAAAVRRWFGSDFRTLGIHGPEGSGKSWLGYAILRVALDEGLRVHGCSAVELVRTMTSESDRSPVPRLAGTADMFLVDDVEPEHVTDVECARVIHPMMMRRSEVGLRTILTSRQPPSFTSQIHVQASVVLA